MDSATLAKQIQDYDSKRKSSADLLNEALAEKGVPEIRDRVANLRTTLTNTENALNAVDPSVTGRTSRSLVTEAQRQRMVANERQPLAQQYGEQERAFGNESSNLTTMETAARQIAEGRINDYTVGRQALQSQYDVALARELEQRRREEADRAYQLQQQQLAEAKRQATAASTGYSLGGGYSPAAPQSSGNTVKNRAVADVGQLMARKGTKDFYQEVNAIAKSAGYGNAYDQAKLELIRAAQPGLFNSNGSLNVGRINALLGMNSGGGGGW